MRITDEKRRASRHMYKISLQHTCMSSAASSKKSTMPVLEKIEETNSSPGLGMQRFNSSELKKKIKKTFSNSMEWSILEI